MDNNLTVCGGRFGQLLSPTNHQPMRIERQVGQRSAILSDGERFWPMVEGISYLRIGREDLCRAAVAALSKEDPITAAAILLTDQDRFAPPPAPTEQATSKLLQDVRTGSVTFREAMARLEFGPVAHYFAHRWSAPTFLSGLGLLASRWSEPGAICEVACGVGQFLRELAWHGVPSLGIDVVFAKLWLARHFIGVTEDLICADVESGPLPLSGQANPRLTTFCHDAFYFFQDKAHVARELCGLAGNQGTVLLGHVHNASVDHGVAGTPLTPQGYAEHFHQAELFDDADFVDAYLEREVPRVRTADELMDVEAISLAWRGSQEPCWDTAWHLCDKPDQTRPRLNPLLRADERNALRPDWPDQWFAEEYRSATYLNGESMPDVNTLRRAKEGQSSPEINRLYKRRVLLNLPERW